MNLRSTQTGQTWWWARLGFSIALGVLFLTALLWSLWGVTPARADPGTLYVDGALGQDTSTCGTVDAPCQTISYTVNSRAIDGDTILIAASTYTENLTISGVTLTLRGGYNMSGTLWLPGSGETVIDGNGADRVFLIHGNNSVLENLIITGGDTPDDQCWGGGVWITNGDVTIRDSLITGNWADCSGGGIEVNSDWGPAHLTLVDSIVFGNQSGGDCGGVSVWHTGAHLTNMLIVSNTGSNGSAMRIEDADVTIQNCTVADNQGGVAINAYDTDDQPDALTLRNAIAWGNTDTNLACTVQTCTVTHSDVGGGWAGVGNVDADPQFADPSNGDYHLLPWSPCIDVGTVTGAPDYDLDGVARPQNAGYDMGAYEFVGTPFQNEGTRYVATSGSDAGPNLCLDPHAPCATVGHAVGMANAGESVWISGGTYTENLNISKPLTLTGGYVPGTAWVPGGEAILDGSGSPTVWGDWDGNDIYAPAVITDSGQLVMWYSGHMLDGSAQIGQATSAEGITWTKSLSNPLLSGYEAMVIKDGPGDYKMWFTNGGGIIYRATSSDGLAWSINPSDPVFQPTYQDGSWDRDLVSDPSIVQDAGGTYWMFYEAANWDWNLVQIGVATSTNGMDWTRPQNGPVLTPGDPGDWDESWVLDPMVVYEGSTFKMWYSGIDSADQRRIGYATSSDGLNWSKDTAHNPIFAGDPGQWDDGNVHNHYVHIGGNYQMWYSSNGQIGYVTSTEGITWTRSLTAPVLTPGASGQWGGPVVYFEDSSDGSVLDGLAITGGSSQQAGGVDASQAQVTIRHCLIHGNFANGTPNHWGGGGVLAGNDGATIEDSIIVDNHAIQGASGVRVGEGLLTMVNTLVADNTGDEGLHLNGSATLMNVTVAGNATGTGRPGINFNPQTGGNLEIVNSIVYGNGDVIHVPDPGTVQASYSDIEGGWPGTGNIDADPQFVDPDNGDHHLQGGSPAIDKGTPANAPPADLDGTPRDARPDMGAYEYQRLDHDVAVVDVLPSGRVAINVPFPIRATLYNVGSSTENNIPVTCEIEHGGSTVYSQIVNSGQLHPLTWQVLKFPSHTPTSQGLYTLTCQSNLPGDQRTANDTYTRRLMVLEEIADVWTKDNPDDDGDVPSGLHNWYESPDLWVRRQDDGGLIHQDPVKGQTNTVYVRLRNRGTVAISGTVDVYWIEPSLGVRCGDWAYINTIPFIRLLPGEVRIVSTPWIPTRTGHTCLQDVIDSPQDPYNRALECAPQWVPWDNNVEWHNVNIIENPEGGIASVQDVKQAEVRLVNVYNLPQDVDLIIERMTFPSTGTITVQLPAGLFDRWWNSGERWSEGVEVVTATKEISVTGAVSATIGAIPMRAAEKAAVGLTFDGPAGLTFEMAIRERIDGITIGGVGYQWTIPDTTPPSVTDQSPADAATDVTLDAPIVITFDEEIAPRNFSLTLTPTLEVAVTWNEAGTIATATHAGFAAGTSYTATVMASDAAANAMDAPFRWTFTTESNQIYLPLVLRNS